MTPSMRVIARRIAPYFPSSIVRFARYPREFLFDRRLLKIRSNQPSVIFFTSNKSASKLMGRMLRKLNKDVLHLTPLNLAGYYWDSTGGISVKEYLSQKKKRFFLGRGVLYGPLRSYVDISELGDIRILAMLRDPRDKLVSSYMWAHKHRPPLNPQRRRAFLSHLKQIEGCSLHENVLKFAPTMLARYEEFRLNIPRDVLLTYEQLWQDPDAYISELGRILKVDIGIGTRRDLKRMIDAHFNKRDAKTGRVVRVGRPGEFREKLPPEIVDELTQIFSKTLSWMYD